MRRLIPTGFPIWARLLVGIFAVGLALLIPISVLVASGIGTIATETALSYLDEFGAQQAIDISQSISQSRDAFDRFADDTENQRAMLGLLRAEVVSDVSLNLPDIDRETLERLFLQGLLQRAGNTFENVRLLDRDGVIVARAAVAGPTTVTDDSDVGSPIFLAAEAALLQGRDRVFNLSYRTTPKLEYARAILWRDGTIIGYVVGRMSNARVMVQYLVRRDTLLPTTSFVADTQGTLTAPTLAVRATLGGVNPAIIERARIGQTGTDQYTRADGVDVYGYYTPISGTPFFLFSEVESAAALSRTASLFGIRVGIIVAGLAILTVLFVVIMNQLLAPPLRRLRDTAGELAQGDLTAEIPGTNRTDEIGELATGLVSMRDSLRGRIDDLQQRLELRGRDIAATQEIGRYAASQRDLQTLIDRVVDLIIERFPSIYHAQIFLLDDERRSAMVRASTGEVGRELIRRGHQLGVGSISVIGQVTDQGRTIHARDTEASQVHRPNPLLPDTRAELAIPLRVGETIIGALDVQSREREAFTDDLINVLTTMADQVAIAIQNARLFQEVERRSNEMERANRAETLRAWQIYMRDQRARVLEKTEGQPNSEQLEDLRRAAMISGQPVTGPKTTRNTYPVAVPIVVRGQILGAVEWELPAATFTPDKIELARELAARLAVSLDNARLFEESRRSAERERIVNEIAASLTAQTSIDSILQTAVREVGQALRAPKVSIRLRPADAAQPKAEHTPASIQPIARRDEQP
jgi:GAF domain-containing protein/HAMP domain-containing protein